MRIDRRGLLLTEYVDMAFLKQLEPQFFRSDGYVKFVIDEKTQSVVVGMEIHRDCIEILASQRDYELNFDESGVWGGNLYYDGRIVWTSTLNINKNIRELKKWGSNPREISDTDTIDRLTSILKTRIAF